MDTIFRIHSRLSRGVAPTGRTVVRISGHRNLRVRVRNPYVENRNPCDKVALMVCVSSMRMNSSDQLIKDYLALADIISFEYANIPGISHDDARSEAQMALMRAVGAFDPKKGEIAAFASKAIRNALNTLYAKQLRIARMFPESLDAPPQELFGTCHERGSSDGPGEKGDSSQDVVAHVRRRETRSILENLLKLLSPRERLVIDGIRKGGSLAEIGNALGVSKQAVHKSARVGMEKLRLGLGRLGYVGIASDGQLESKKSGLNKPG